MNETKVLMDEYKKVIINSLITTFALDKALFNDIDGGNVQTIHNAENGVYANELFAERGNREYNRDDYATANYMNSRRKEDFNNNEVIRDGYTGKVLNKDGTTHLEHIVSAKENHDNVELRILFDEREMSEIINDKKNTLYTNSSLNQSKGELSLKEWESKPSSSQKELSNADRYELDIRKSHKADEKARDYINETILNRKIEHYAKSITEDSLKQGGKMALRQTLGVILTEALLEFSDDVETINQNGNTSEDFFENCTRRLQNICLKLAAKWKDLLGVFVTGALTGAITSIFTSVVNMFFSTAKNIVTIIRQIIVSITQALKVLLFDDKNMSFGERVVEASKILLVGINSVVGVLISQVTAELLSKTGLQHMAVLGEILFETLPIILGAIASGLLTVTVLHFIETSDEINKLIKFLNNITTNMFDSALSYYSEVNTKLDEIILKIAECDLTSYQKRVQEIESIIPTIGWEKDLGDLDYEKLKLMNIKLQFSNFDEFDKFMIDESTTLIF